jgi:hypothetical protein
MSIRTKRVVIDGETYIVTVCPPADVSGEFIVPTAKANHAGYHRYLRDLQDERQAGRKTYKTVGISTFDLEDLP